MKRSDVEHVLRAAGAITGAGICPAPADLAVSKLAAWRDKDRDFVRSLFRNGIVRPDELRSRLDELSSEIASRIEPRLRGLLMD